MEQNNKRRSTSSVEVWSWQGPVKLAEYDFNQSINQYFKNISYLTREQSPDDRMTAQFQRRAPTCLLDG